MNGLNAEDRKRKFCKHLRERIDTGKQARKLCGALRIAEHPFLHIDDYQTQHLSLIASTIPRRPRQATEGAATHRSAIGSAIPASKVMGLINRAVLCRALVGAESRPAVTPDPDLILPVLPLDVVDF